MGHNISFNSENISTINAQLFLFCSIITLPIFNSDLIILRTYKSSICKFILNLNLIYVRSNVMEKHPSPSVNPENKNKNSLFNLCSLVEKFLFVVVVEQAAYKDLVIEQDSILFLCRQAAPLIGIYTKCILQNKHI